MPNFDYLPHSQLLELRRWNTPTVYNGWECVTKRNRLDCNCSWEPGLVDFTPQMGPMVGYAVTVEYVCGDAALTRDGESHEIVNDTDRSVEYLAVVLTY